MLMMLVSACTLISACAAVLYVFFSFFIENTQEDIEYVLNSTSQQFQSHMQFIEDGAVSIRHNMMLNDFLIQENLELIMTELWQSLNYHTVWNCFLTVT